MLLDPPPSVAADGPYGGQPDGVAPVPERGWSRSGPTACATPWPPSCSSRGVRLPEIAQVLRQRDLATTAVYAKVDYPALRELALPWLVA